MSPAADAAEPCRHGLDPSTCSLCLHPSRVAPRRQTTAFVARYDGFCPACEENFEAGTEIVRVNSGEYLHVECAAAQ